MPTKELAKALHTLTATTNVATYLKSKTTYKSGAELARATLIVLNPGYDYTAAELAGIRDKRDRKPLFELIGRILDNCDAIIAGQPMPW